MLLIALLLLQAAPLAVGQQVEVKDFGASDWHGGRVIGMKQGSRGLEYRIEHKRGNFTVETDFPAAQVRAIGAAAAGPALAGSPAYALGDTVEIKDHASEQWLRGKVIEVIPEASDGSLYRYKVRYRSGRIETDNAFYPNRIRHASGPVDTATLPSSSALGGPLVPGNYACTFDTWTGAAPYRQRHSEPKGYLSIAAGGAYRWLDNGGGGAFRYDAASGALTFATGPLAAKRPQRVTYRRNQRTTQIDIRFADGVEWSCGHNL